MTRFEPPPLSGSRGKRLCEEDTLIGGPELIDVRVSLPSDTSFREYATALAHLRGPKLPADTDLCWEQGVLDASLDARSHPTSRALRSTLACERWLAGHDCAAPDNAGRPRAGIRAA